MARLTFIEAEAPARVITYPKPSALPVSDRCTPTLHDSGRACHIPCQTIHLHRMIHPMNHPADHPSDPWIHLHLHQPSAPQYWPLSTTRKSSSTGANLEPIAYRADSERTLSTPCTARLQASVSPMSPTTTSTAGGMASAAAPSRCLTSAFTCRVAGIRKDYYKI